MLRRFVRFHSRGLNRRHFSSNNEEYTALDRLLRFKPAITSETNEDDTDGLPEDENEDDMTEEERRDPRYLVGKQLLKFGKVNYRHIEPVPNWLQSKQRDVCSHRTIPQIRRCLDNWMVKTDREELERYRLLKLSWRKTVKEGKKEKEAIAYGPEETVAYTHYFMPGRFSITKRVLRETQNLLPNFKPTRVLDYGCGPATGGAAVVDIFGADVKKYTGIDMSRSMIDAAKVVMESLGKQEDGASMPTTAANTKNTNNSKHNDSTSKPLVSKRRGEKESLDDSLKGLSVDSIFYDKIAEVVRRAENKGDRYDLIIASYTLTELTSDPARRAATQLLFELLDEGGVLVLVEQGNPKGSHAVRTARQLILDGFGANRGGGSSSSSSEKTEKSATKKNKSKPSPAPGDTDIKQQQPEKLIPVLPAPKGLKHADLAAFTIAPCTHDKPCPLAQGVWCSFSQRVHGGVIRQTSEEKFSYVVLQKRRLLKEEGGGQVGLLRLSPPPPLKRGGLSTPWLNKEEQGGSNAHDSIDLWTTPFGKPTAAGTVHIGDAGKYSTSSATNLVTTKSHAHEGVTATHTNHQESSEFDPTPLEVLSRLVAVEDGEDLKVEVDKLFDEVDWEEYNPPLYRNQWGRVLRSPIKVARHVTLDICLPNGEVSRNVLSKSNVVNVPALYTAMRKTTWGGLFPVLLDDEHRSPLTVGRKGVAPTSFLTQDKKLLKSASAAAAAAAPVGGELSNEQLLRAQKMAAALAAAEAKESSETRVGGRTKVLLSKPRRGAVATRAVPGDDDDIEFWDEGDEYDIDDDGDDDEDFEFDVNEFEPEEEDEEVVVVRDDRKKRAGSLRTSTSKRSSSAAEEKKKDVDEEDDEDSKGLSKPGRTGRRPTTSAQRQQQQQLQQEEISNNSSKATTKNLAGGRRGGEVREEEHEQEETEEGEHSTGTGRRQKKSSALAALAARRRSNK